MSVSNPQRDPGHRAVQASFFAGLCLIGLATVHNVGFEGMNTADRMTLPTFLANTYAKTGKLGVTVFLVSSGLLVMASGFLVRCAYAAPKRTSTWAAPERLVPNPSWNTDSAASINGRVELATQKYLRWPQQTDMTPYETAQG
jgi:hypothetical protein